MYVDTDYVFYVCCQVCGRCVQCKNCGRRTAGDVSLFVLGEQGWRSDGSTCLPPM